MVKNSKGHRKGSKVESKIGGPGFLFMQLFSESSSEKGGRQTEVKKAAGLLSYEQEWSSKTDAHSSASLAEVKGLGAKRRKEKTPYIFREHNDQ